MNTKQQGKIAGWLIAVIAVATLIIGGTVVVIGSYASAKTYGATKALDDIG